MNRRIVSIVLLFTVVALMGIQEALATPDYLADFNAKYGTTGTRLDTCNTCHISVPSLNPYGINLDKQLINLTSDPSAADPATVDKALANIEPLDSDGDGFSNIVEIHNLTFPGNASDKPVTVSPTATANVTANVTVSPTANVTANVTVSPTANVTVSPTATAKVTVSPTANVTVSPVVTRTVIPTITPAVTGTPTAVPEFPTVILPVAAVMGLMLLLLYRRRG